MADTAVTETALFSRVECAVNLLSWRRADKSAALRVVASMFDGTKTRVEPVAVIPISCFDTAGADLVSIEVPDVVLQAEDTLRRRARDIAPGALLPAKFVPQNGRSRREAVRELIRYAVTERAEAIGVSEHPRLFRLLSGPSFVDLLLAESPLPLIVIPAKCTKRERVREIVTNVAPYVEAQDAFQYVVALASRVGAGVLSLTERPPLAGLAALRKDWARSRGVRYSVRSVRYGMGLDMLRVTRMLRSPVAVYVVAKGPAHERARSLAEARELIRSATCPVIVVPATARSKARRLVHVEGRANAG